jgi:hypothetical protein
VQPLLDFHGSDLLKPLRSPVGIDVPLQINSGPLDGSERLPFGNEFVFSMVGYEIGHLFGRTILGVDGLLMAVSFICNPQKEVHIVYLSRGMKGGTWNVANFCVLWLC